MMDGGKRTLFLTLFLKTRTFQVTNHSVPGRSRAAMGPGQSNRPCPERSRRAGPVVFRILPQQSRAKARAEGPCGKRALPHKSICMGA